jgi:hypothetical protein
MRRAPSGGMSERSPHLEHWHDAHSLAALARDPAIIPGIYDACDQWCAYCPATHRCLAFRATNAAVVGGVFDASGAEGCQVAEGTLFLKMLADAEGRLAPPEIEAAVSGDREHLRRVFTIDDALERLGRRYLMVVDAYLGSRPDFPPACEYRPEGPTAFEVLAWHHVLAPARIFRAILSDAEAREGIRGRRIDTLRSAKVALISIERSVRALADLSTTDDDPRLDLLRGLLRQLGDAVDARFPGAREYVRPGLDAQPPRKSSLRRGLRRLRRLLHWPDERPVDQAPGDLRGSARRAGPSRG